MGVDLAKVETVSTCLARLRDLCDSGFALAVHIRYTRPTLLYRTYGQAWIDHYSEKGYMLTDPVVHWGLSQGGRIDWSELAGQDPEGVLAAAAAHGLRHGWSYTVGPATSRTLSGLTRSASAFSDAERAEIIGLVDRIHAATEGFDALSPATQEALRTLT
jgi:LuxR family transcriptional regulator